jgi:hypothetical protein
MLSGFEESSSFEEPCPAHALVVEGKEDVDNREGGFDDWFLHRKVKLLRQDDWDEGELVDSCCFGTRTVQASIGTDYI